MYQNIILIPYRNREEHKLIFFNEVTKIFIKYLKPFKIIIIEQLNNKDFNRAKLLNVGFNEFKNLGFYFFHHDIDIIPNEETVSKLYINTDYDVLRIFNAHDISLGGIVKFKKDSFVKINGLPNYIWGWGIEDRVFFYRSKIMKLNISENFSKKENFKFLNHKSNRSEFTGIKKKISDEEDYIYNQETINNQINHINSNGLNNMTYKIISKKEINQFITLIQVDI
jgi:hypothetical protein